MRGDEKERESNSGKWVTLAEWSLANLQLCAMARSPCAAEIARHFRYRLFPHQTAPQISHLIERHQFLIWKQCYLEETPAISRVPLSFPGDIPPILPFVRSLRRIQRIPNLQLILIPAVLNKSSGLAGNGRNALGSVQDEICRRLEQKGEGNLNSVGSSGCCSEGPRSPIESRGRAQG